MQSGARVAVLQRYDASAEALFLRMSEQPAPGRRRIISNLIEDLKAAGIWTRLDLLYLFAAHDAQTARLNWKSATGNLSESGAPTFTADRQYTGDATDDFLDSGVAWSALTNYLQDDNCLFVFERADSTSGFAVGSTGTAQRNRILGRSSTTATSRTSCATSIAGTVSTAVGFTLAQRTGAATEEIFRNGVSLATATNTSAARDTGNVAILRDNATYSARRVSVVGVGASLTAAQNVTLYNSIINYLLAVGA